MARVEYDQGAARTLFLGEIQQVLGRVARDVQRAAEDGQSRKLQRRTGVYAGSFGTQPIASGGWEIENTARYAAWLELGTNPHIINGNPTLRFVVGGRVVFAKTVRHPGTRPYRILTDALEQVVRGVLT